MIMDRWKTENYMKRLEKDNIVRAIPITEGMTICFNNATSYYEEKNSFIFKRSFCRNDAWCLWHTGPYYRRL